MSIENEVAATNVAPAPSSTCGTKMLSLGETLTACRAYSDQTHKFWGYYQAATAAAVGFAWASTSLPEHVRACLAAAYLAFALFNRRLVMEAQAAYSHVWNSIQIFALREADNITEEFRGNLSLVEPEKPEKVGLLHVVLSAAAAAAILLRDW